MSAKIIAALVVLTILNAVGLAINFALPSRAAVGGLSYQELVRDPDFLRAVQSIVQECKVNVDLAKLTCVSVQK
jgi:hypothetical protein